VVRLSQPARVFAASLLGPSRTMSRPSPLVLLLVLLLAAAAAASESAWAAAAAAQQPPPTGEQQQQQQIPPQAQVNPYLATESPYEDTDGDGQLSTEEVRAQWEGWMGQVPAAAKESDWPLVIELSYKILHDPGPTEASIRYNLAFALNAVEEYAKAKGELKASIDLAEEAGDVKIAERSL
jgi:hypothetical protein